MRWARCPAEAAEVLGVDVPTLLTRLATLTPASHAPVATRPAVP